MSRFGPGARSRFLAAPFDDVQRLHNPKSAVLARSSARWALRRAEWHDACELPVAMYRRTLREQVVVITGASRGIGRATAVAFAREGARIVLAARSKGDLEATARLCREAGDTALVVVTDVTREAHVQNLAWALRELVKMQREHGPKRGARERMHVFAGALADARS